MDNNKKNNNRSNSIPHTGASNYRNIPFHLECVFCKIEKSYQEFSANQLEKALFKSSTGRKFNAVCRECSPTQKLSLTCFICNKKQPSNQFSKAQRGSTQSACYKCTLKR